MTHEIGHSPCRSVVLTGAPGAGTLVRSAEISDSVFVSLSVFFMIRIWGVLNKDISAGPSFSFRHDKYNLCNQDVIVLLGCSHYMCKDGNQYVIVFPGCSWSSSYRRYNHGNQCINMAISV